MADTATPTTGANGPETPVQIERRTARPRRKSDVAPRAEVAARRTKMVQLAIFAIAAVITIDAVVGEKGLLETFRARRAYAQQVSELNRLKQLNAHYRDYARRLKEDPAAIEEAARRNLGLVKPGEVLVIVRDAEKR